MLTNPTKLLRRYLEQHDMRISVLARKAGIHRQSIDQYVQGRCVPSARNAAALARATEGMVPADDWIRCPECRAHIYAA